MAGRDFSFTTNVSAFEETNACREQLKGEGGRSQTKMKGEKPEKGHVERNTEGGTGKEGAHRARDRERKWSYGKRRGKHMQ